MSRYSAGVLALVVLVVSGVMFFSSSQAHRSGCHRWHSCPSDSGSYSCGDLGYANYCGNGPTGSNSSVQGSGRSNFQSSQGLISKPVRPKAKRPTAPRYVVPGVAYFWVGSLNGSLGTVSPIKRGFYRLTVNQRFMQIRRGYKTIYYGLKPGGSQYKKVMKSPVIYLDGRLYMPVYAMGFLGCGVDSHLMASKKVTLSCGNHTKVVNIKIW